MIEVEEAVIPELRFPEYNGDWKEIRFGELVGRSNEKYNPQNSSQNYQCIELENLSQNTGLLFDTINAKDQKSIKNKFSEGQILFGKLRPYLRKFYKATFEGVCTSEIWVLYGKKIKNDFLYYLIQTNKFNYQINLTIGSKMPRADWGHISAVSFCFPSIPEQQKIATFLTAVDKRIQLLQQKKEKLERYKKGVMQKLFSQEIRFKDEKGEDFPDWEEKKLGEVTNIYDGTHQTPKYVESGIPFYSVEHISANQFSSTKYISEKVFEKENQRVRLESGDILMTRIGSIGVAKYIDWDVRASFYVSLALLKQRADYDGKFLSYAIHNSRFQRELWKRTIHVAFPQKINLGEIGKCRISLPSLPEQKRIAAFLSSLDKKIDQVTQQIEHTRQWKKGLLQKMFV